MEGIEGKGPEGGRTRGCSGNETKFKVTGGQRGKNKLRVVGTNPTTKEAC